jgi:hypothetical protein
MKGKMRTALVGAALLASAGCSGPTFEEGLTAYQQGNHEEAAQVWRQLAREGHPRAQHHLANLYRGGLGVDRDLARSAHWAERAATQGHPQAQFNLAHLMDKGMGVERDPAKAYKWYRRAAVGLPSRKRRAEARHHAERLAGELTPQQQRQLRRELKNWAPEPE